MSKPGKPIKKSSAPPVVVEKKSFVPPPAKSKAPVVDDMPAKPRRRDWKKAQREADAAASSAAASEEKKDNKLQQSAVRERTAADVRDALRVAERKMEQFLAHDAATCRWNDRNQRFDGFGSVDVNNKYNQLQQTLNLEGLRRELEAIEKRDHQRLVDAEVGGSVFDKALYEAMVNGTPAPSFFKGSVTIEDIQRHIANVSKLGRLPSHAFPLVCRFIPGSFLPTPDRLAFDSVVCVHWNEKGEQESCSCERKLTRLPLVSAEHGAKILRHEVTLLNTVLNQQLELARAFNTYSGERSWFCRFGAPNPLYVDVKRHAPKENEEGEEGAIQYPPAQKGYFNLEVINPLAVWLTQLFNRREIVIFTPENLERVFLIPSKDVMDKKSSLREPYLYCSPENEFNAATEDPCFWTLPSDGDKPEETENDLIL